MSATLEAPRTRGRVRLDVGGPGFRRTTHVPAGTKLSAAVGTVANVTPGSSFRVGGREATGDEELVADTRVMVSEDVSAG